MQKISIRLKMTKTINSYIFRLHWPIIREYNNFIKRLIDILVSCFYTEELPVVLLARHQYFKRPHYTIIVLANYGPIGSEDAGVSGVCNVILI
jgi:hypothetical protein